MSGKGDNKSGYYAVGHGRNPGVYTTWGEARAQTDGFSGATFKSFESRAEASRFVSHLSGLSNVASGNQGGSHGGSSQGSNQSGNRGGSTGGYRGSY